MTTKTLDFEENRGNSSNTLPMVSIIMPVRNERSHIDASLGAVLAQDYPADRLEVIMADGMSTDQTRSSIIQFQKTYPNLRLVDNQKQITSAGLNVALLSAIGDIIVRVDGHTEIARNYVSQCVQDLLCSGADNVGGRMIARGDTPFGDAVALATSTSFGVGGARFHFSEREEWVDTVYLGTWHRHLFERLGLFDEEQECNEDDEFNYRLLKNGGKIFLSPRIQSNYLVRNRPQKLAKQYYRYGFWKVRVLQKHPLQMRARQFVPLIFVIALLITFALGLANPGMWLPFLLITGPYLFIDIAVSIWLAVRKSWRCLFILPIIFPILHCSYGFGFLAGLGRFILRWGDKEGQVPQLKKIDL